MLTPVASPGSLMRGLPGSRAPHLESGGRPRASGPRMSWSSHPAWGRSSPVLADRPPGTLPGPVSGPGARRWKRRHGAVTSPAKATQLPSGRGRIRAGSRAPGLPWGTGVLSGHRQAVIIYTMTVHSSDSKYSLHLARHEGQIEGVFGWENVVPRPGPGQGRRLQHDSDPGGFPDPLWASLGPGLFWGFFVPHCPARS